MENQIKTSINIEVVKVFDRVQLVFSNEKEEKESINIAMSLEGASKLAELLRKAIEE